MAVGCLAERYGKDLAESLPEADAVLGFDDYPDIAARLRSIVAGETHHPHTPQDRRRLLPISPGRARRQRAERPGPRPTGGLDELGVGGPRHRPPRRAPPPRRRPDGPAQAGQRLRPPLLVLRDPGVPRLVRQPPAQRRAAGGAVAGDAGRARAVPGQRELHLLRQGPRRPAAARDAAARAGRRRRRRAGPGLLPPARRDPARPGRGDRDDARASRRTSTCPSSTPAATVLRRMRRFGDPESFLGLLEQIRRHCARRPACGPT